MAEPPAAASSAIAAPQRDVLLATKLYMPASQLRLVSRPRLAERLDEGLVRGVILVCAPGPVSQQDGLTVPGRVAVAGCWG